MTQPSRLNNLILGLIVGVLALLLLQSVMSATSTQTVLLGIIAGLIAVLAVQPVYPAYPKTIEYIFVPYGSMTQSLLDESGKEGWQLVCPDQAGKGYIFSR